jgi:ABC-2 type transport system permease protein
MHWKTLFNYELRSIFSNIPLLVTVFGGVFIYSFLYPLPYINQTPTKQNIAIINLDNSPISRKIERMVNATPQVNISEQQFTIKQAKASLIKGDISGFLLIPENFYKDLLLKKSPHLVFAGNAAYFLVYGTIIEGLVRSASTVVAEVKVSKMVMSGENIALAASQYTPIGLNLKPTFNPSMGYINYIVPAVFILILHQTLLIAAGLLTAGQCEQKLQQQSSTTNNKHYWLNFPAWQILLVRSAIMLSIYLLLSCYYFGFSFEYYGISKNANMVDLLRLTIPFLLSVIFLGIIIGLLIPRKELATLIVLILSLPLVFCAGFIWPTTNIPAGINTVAQLFPSTPAINGFLRLNQMGDNFDNLINIRLHLWLLTFFYGLLSLSLMATKQHNRRKANTHMQ